MLLPSKQACIKPGGLRTRVTESIFIPAFTQDALGAMQGSAFHILPPTPHSVRRGGGLREGDWPTISQPAMVMVMMMVTPGLLLPEVTNN